MGHPRVRVSIGDQPTAQPLGPTLQMARRLGGPNRSGKIAVSAAAELERIDSRDHGERTKHSGCSVSRSLGKGWTLVITIAWILRD